MTGAGGFIGLALSRRLSDEGARVLGLDVDESARDRVAAAGARFERCDTTDPRAVREVLDGAELLVHAAARVSDWGPMEDFVRVNVEGTRNVLDAALEAGVGRLVHISSVAIWGYEHRRELDEDAPARPCGIPYIDTKGTSDALALRRARAGAPIAIVRPGDVYGPGSIPWAVRPLEAIRNRQFMLIDGGKGLMVPVYVDDLVDSVLLALTLDGAVGQAFTVWDGNAVTCAEFFSHYAQMLGKSGIPSLPRPLAAAAAAAQEAVARARGRQPAFSRNAISFVSRRAGYSNRRAREVLGWEPKVTLDEGMRRTRDWFREQGLI